MTAYEKGLYTDVCYTFSLDFLKDALNRTENAIVQELIFDRIKELTEKVK